MFSITKQKTNSNQAPSFGDMSKINTLGSKFRVQPLWLFVGPPQVLVGNVILFQILLNSLMANKRTPRLEYQIELKLFILNRASLVWWTGTIHAGRLCGGRAAGLDGAAHPTLAGNGPAKPCRPQVSSANRVHYFTSFPECQSMPRGVSHMFRVVLPVPSPGSFFAKWRNLCSVSYSQCRKDLKSYSCVPETLPA